MTTTPQSTAGRPWFALYAGVAWLGLGMQFVLSATGMYPSTTTIPSAVGYNNPPGAAGALPRIFDLLSYFTIWSNIVVAVLATLLALRPWRDSHLLRVLQLDALIMITVTGLVYAVLLGPTATLSGWQYPANSLLHQITPLVTVIVFLVAGPRGRLAWRTIPEALVLPLVWVGYTLVRGAVIGAYPYPFIDVVRLGYGQVLINVVGIAVFGVIIGAIFVAIDRWLSRRRSAKVSA